MAADTVAESARRGEDVTNRYSNGSDDPFTEGAPSSKQPYYHRFSSKFEIDAVDIGAASSPSQVKHVLEAHLQETERRLQDTHKLGTSLLQQQSELQDKLREVEQQQDETEITPELRQKLVSIGKEHDDVSREIARSLLAPKSRAVSGEEQLGNESVFLTSQATGSPTKIAAPNRRSRNQPTNRAGDLQFYADISTSFLAQVRQLQGMVAERDEALKNVNAERSKLEQDAQVYVQRLRSYDENEQKYKDENWNLQAQTHELLSAQREAADREKRLNGTVTVAVAERARLLSEVEEFKLAHSKAVDDHNASKKAHETELHSLKRDFDGADLDRSSLQTRVDELTAQNRELAKAMSSQLRNQSPQRQPQFNSEDEDMSRDLSTPEHSPPPSPTKQTPRHGGLESETLKSSLHHAHRMIQNLKGNIHREKTEKIELKRMLQEARDELEQRRSDNGFGSGSKKQKPTREAFKKPIRSDMLGGTRRAVTDIEVQDDEWEDQANDTASQTRTNGHAPTFTHTDLSDAYQTAQETESSFETADERMTESEAFMTGAESLAGDSTDDLTETESTAPSRNRASIKHNRPSLASRAPGARDSYLSTASTSAGEEDDQAQTPVQPQPYRFKLRNGRSSSSRRTQVYEGTPDTVRTQETAENSPLTVTEGRSPPGVEQSLFAELEAIYDTSSNFSTPARSNVMSTESTPGTSDTPSKTISSVAPEVVAVVKPAMVDSSMMTDPWQPESAYRHSAIATSPGLLAAYSPAMTASDGNSRIVSIGDFPLPPSSPPVQRVDTGTQYTPTKDEREQSDVETTPQQTHDHSVQHTPSRTLQDSPVRTTNTFITPPKTVWDAEHESEIHSPERGLTTKSEKPNLRFSYSGLLAQDTVPMLPTEPVAEPPPALAFSSILSQQTQPIAPPPSQPPTAPLPPIPSGTKRERSASDKAATGIAGGGLLAGAAAVFGLSRAKDKDEGPQIAEDSTSGAPETSPVAAGNLKDVSGNATLRKKTSANEENLKRGAPVTISRNDQSVQTLITSVQIEKALRTWDTDKNVTVKPPTIPEPPTVSTQKVLARSPDFPEVIVSSSSSAPTSPPLRPSSAPGFRPPSVNKQHPPLPMDYKTNIARANSQLQNNLSRKDSVPAVAGTVMGPPLMPASAMRRPKTPSGSMRSPSKENATPRGQRSSRNRGNGGTDSQLSRRSSVSSFASELDERFNIRTGTGYDAMPGTDPRMIQAITQTMIGEYLWKYTRKTGSKEMSTTRHKRYFWVHPYTKTLYWSTADPSLPGSKESTSRSVPIESIRVVTDDNPMPPGLHRKSLEITTPTRKVKFTATTGQRHETWFNALSYLLLRGEQPEVFGAYSSGGNEITRDDIDEFRVSGHNPTLRAPSRTSMSSYNSRTTTGTAKRVSGTAGPSQRQGLPANVTSNSLRHQNSVSQNSSTVPGATESGRVSRAESTQNFDKDRTIRASSVSRVSRMLGSITGRHSKQSIIEPTESQQAGHTRGPSRESNSIYDASVVSANRDSAEETRQEMLRQEAAGLGSGNGLENVRACCDGKHDVSTLHHHHRHEQNRTLHSMSERINRSMSKRV